MSSAQTRIILAVVAGVIMMAWAFWVTWTKQDITTAEATHTSALSARRHIPVTDSNRDGVPDWQSRLITSEPIYLDATTTEEYQVPDTVTGQFTAMFFEDMMTLESFGLLKSTQEELIRSAILKLEEMTNEKQYVEADLTNIVATTDPFALRAYGNLVAGNIFHYQTDDENEYDVYSRLVQDNNPRHLEKLAVLEQQYDNIIAALLTLEVPEKYVFEHLAILNSISALKENVTGMKLHFDDPIYTLMRFRRLEEDALRMSNSVHSLYDALYLDEKIQFAKNETLPVLAELLQKI